MNFGSERRANHCLLTERNRAMDEPSVSLSKMLVARSCGM
ncbi:hypothetical protein LINGRAHAP2_LOCUS36423 [Linum grandiflorum]